MPVVPARKTAAGHATTLALLKRKQMSWPLNSNIAKSEQISHKNTLTKMRMLHQKGFHPIENCNVPKSCENDSTIHKRLFLLTRMALFFVEDKKQRTFYELSLLLSYFALMYL